jgi:hypothetical protein
MTSKTDEQKLRPYQTPVLRVFGAMATLTASGTGVDFEPAANAGPGLPRI